MLIQKSHQKLLTILSEQHHTEVSNLLVAGKSATNSTSQAILPLGSSPKVLQPPSDPLKSQVVQQSYASDLSKVFGGFVSCSIGSVVVSIQPAVSRAKIEPEFQ